MITFREHIEISKYIEKNNTISEYIDKQSPEKKIDLIRNIAETYPLEKDIDTNLNTLKNKSIVKSVYDLVLGQFIMIEQIITGKSNYEYEAINDLELAKLIIRPSHHEVFDNENDEQEKQNEENILNASVQDVYSVLQGFLNNREFVLFEQFKGVFYEVPDEENDEEDSTEEERTAESLFQQQWYWYSMVRMLAKEDITKYEEIYMLNMSTVMPEMSYLAQKNKIEAARQRQQQALSKL
tara:strand:+ start:723 stop:1439 length:717 start_codon:yes stop_codon:yes gene_type:complete